MLYAEAKSRRLESWWLRRGWKPSGDKSFLSRYTIKFAGAVCCHNECFNTNHPIEEGLGIILHV